MQALRKKIYNMSTEHKGWIGIDLDGTLASYDEWRGISHIGAPVPKMLALVNSMLADGDEVRIFTARVFRMLYPVGTPERMEGERAISYIQDWLESHGLPRLDVTCVKDFGMIRLYDDRAVQVMQNTGIIVEMEEGD